MFSCIFITEEFDRIEDKGSRDISTFDADTLGVHFEHVPEICLFH
jgi:hypothetical protein